VASTPVPKKPWSPNFSNFKGTITDKTGQIDPEKEARKQAANARYLTASQDYKRAVDTYNAIPESTNPTIMGVRLAARIQMEQRQAELAGYQAAASRESLPEKDRVLVDPSGEAPTPKSPETKQTPPPTPVPDPVPEPVVATEEDLDGFYSDVNPTYILDKRAQIFRTPDKAKHIFFLESYKSIFNAIRQVESDKGVDNSDEEDRDALQDSLRFDTESDSKIKITINRGGILRALPEEKDEIEFDFSVNLPPNEGKQREDYMVDSCLWCTTSFTESFGRIPEEFNVALQPTKSDKVFTFPVFFVSSIEKKTLSPMYNIKYYNLFYDSSTKTIDMVFWTNVRSGWLSDTTGKVEFYSAYPFTREKDLRSVGRVLMATSGWYDTVLIETKAKDEKTKEEVTSQFRRRIFIFNTPSLIHNPGLGGEFPSAEYEPVVDSIPWGFKYVEFTS